MESAAYFDTMSMNRVYSRAKDHAVPHKQQIYWEHHITNVMLLRQHLMMMDRLLCSYEAVKSEFICLLNKSGSSEGLRL